MNLGTAALHYFGKELYNSHFAEIPDVKILKKKIAVLFGTAILVFWIKS